MHSGFAAGPPKCFSASAYSSIFFAPSLSPLAGRWSVAFESVLWAIVGSVATVKKATPRTAAATRILSGRMVSLILLGRTGLVPPHAHRVWSTLRPERPGGSATSVGTGAMAD